MEETTKVTPEGIMQGLISDINKSMEYKEHLPLEVNRKLIELRVFCENQIKEAPTQLHD